MHPAKPSILRSPSTRFLLLGLALFGLWELVATPKPIVVSPALEQALVTERERGLGRGLTAQERQAVVAGWIDEEVLFREALARRLERSDPIVRRRLVQAMQFVIEDESSEPTMAELQQFAAAHPERFTLPARVGFEQAFVGAGDSAAARDALERGAPVETIGLPFATGPRFEAQDEVAVGSAFGASFATAVFALEPGRWTQLDSPYGHHLVRLTSRTPAELPPIEKIAGPVRAALREQRRERASGQQLAALRSAYSIELPRR